MKKKKISGTIYENVGILLLDIKKPCLYPLSCMCRKHIFCRNRRTIPVIRAINNHRRLLRRIVYYVRNPF